MALYYYKDHEGRLVGPLSEVQILDLRDAGQLPDETPICEADTETWSPLAELNLQRPPEPTSRHVTWLAVGGIGLIVVLGFLAHLVYGEFGALAANNIAAPDASPAALHPVMLSRDEITRLRAAQEAAMQANPYLYAEYKDIMSSMQAGEYKFEVAMVKVDPNIVIVIDKRDKMRQLNGDPGGGQLSITPDEVKEFRADYQAAMQANPDLAADHQKWEATLQDFMDKLNVAAVKADPTIAPVIAKINAGRLNSGVPADAPPGAPAPAP